MIELLPIERVLYSVQIHDEMELLKDPLYRDLRWADIHTVSMASHRYYLQLTLARHRVIDDLQNWLICLASSLCIRLQNSNIHPDNHTRLLAPIWPGNHPEELTSYRRTTLQFMI
jgi:hypothetical protein